jgi:putative transcriptional regulator
MESFDDFNLYDELKTSLEEAVAYSKGDKSKARVITRAVVREQPVPKYGAQGVAEVRKKLNLSQRNFALAMGVSPRTVEAWEAGVNTPSGSSRRLLYLLEKDGALVSYLIQR